VADLVTQRVLSEIELSESGYAHLVAHSDKGGSKAKMAIVNEVCEVLSNPELWQCYDNGDDPNDPMQGQGGPFPGGNFGAVALVGIHCTVLPESR
jgi:DnaJ-class molecular chaperone